MSEREWTVDAVYADATGANSRDTFEITVSSDGLNMNVRLDQGSGYYAAYCQDNVPVSVIVQLLEAVGYTVTPRTPAARGA